MFKFGNFEEMVQQLAGIMATYLLAQGWYVDTRKKDLVNTLRSIFLMPVEIRMGFQDATYAGFQQSIAKACREADTFYYEYFCFFDREKAKAELNQMILEAQQWAEETCGNDDPSIDLHEIF